MSDRAMPPERIKDVRISLRDRQSLPTVHPRVVALGGLKQAGKDTVADHMVDAHGFVKFGMSDHVHECLLVLNPWIKIPMGTMLFLPSGTYRYADLDDTLGYVAMKEIPEVRSMLQTFATEVVRNMLDPVAWIRVVEKKIEDAQSMGRDVVLTGMRFKNEILRMTIIGADTAWIDRPGLPAPDNHDSERTLGPDDFRDVLHNDADLPTLHTRIDSWIGAL